MSIHGRLKEHGLFEARVPRYTSYPPATRFSAAIGAQDVRGWIAQIAPGAKISLYVHVPFCSRLCWFCACRTQGTSTRKPLDAYLEHLQGEIALLAELMPHGIEIEHLHWGGGTPTLLPPDSIRTLAEAITGHFPLADGAQFSVEIDPNEVDDARLDALCEAGMNRASIGVQDFDPKIQETIGRIQSYETTQAVISALRARGIASLNMDILYGLPHQTLERISDSVRKVLSLAPDRVALYGYAHVPWMARRQSLIPTDALPTPQERLGQFERARELFLGAGYEEIGIDHFARPQDGLARAHREGTMRRNFQGYTEDTSEILIGIGASSISRYPQGYAQNAPATSEYQKAIASGDLATVRGHGFSPDDLVRGRMIEMLLCDFAIDLGEISALPGASPEMLDDLLAPLSEEFEGLVERSGERFAILPHARPLARIIARRLDAYEMRATGHSLAV